MQLVYDYEFNNILEDIKLWNSIPSNIILKIKDIANSTILYNYEEDKNICPICLNELECNKCVHCNKTYNEDRYIFIDNDTEKYDFIYYVFDVKDNRVFLYELNTSVPIKLPKYFESYKNIKTSIKTVYEVRKDGIYDIINNKNNSFKELSKSLVEDENFSNNVWLYVDNLDKLKNTDVYKYSNIWLLKDYFNNNIFDLYNITYYPVYTREFEYLVKMELYNLAIDGCAYLNKGNSFKSVFGVDKKYYNFMKEINITTSLFKALQLYPTYDIELLKFIDNYCCYFNELKKYVDIKKLKEYFDKQKLLKENINEYYDYIEWCIKLKLNIKNRKVLFPKDFMEEHDRLEKQIIINKDSKINNKIESISKILSINVYEDDKYVIFPASSIDSLLDESRQMHNCVRTYVEKYGNNECQIYFMRYKDNINKSLITIEVNGNKVVQAREKYNKNISEEERKIINRFENSLLKIESR